MQVNTLEWELTQNLLQSKSSCFLSLLFFTFFSSLHPSLFLFLFFSFLLFNFFSSLQKSLFLKQNHLIVVSNQQQSSLSGFLSSHSIPMKKHPLFCKSIRLPIISLFRSHFHFSTSRTEINQLTGTNISSFLLFSSFNFIEINRVRKWTSSEVKYLYQMMKMIVRSECICEIQSILVGMCKLAPGFWKWSFYGVIVKINIDESEWWVPFRTMLLYRSESLTCK